MGVFSRALVSALSRATAGTTYRELFERIAFEVESHRLEQHPQIEGSFDTLLFSGIAKPPSDHLNVIAAQDGTVVLPVGEVHGVTSGSRYALYRAGSGPLDERAKLTEATMEAVEAFQCTLGLASKVVGVSLAAARAIEVEHVYRDSPLRVHFQSLDEFPELMRHLHSLTVIQEQGTSPQDYEV